MYVRSGTVGKAWAMGMYDETKNLPMEKLCRVSRDGVEK